MVRENKVTKMMIGRCVDGQWTYKCYQSLKGEWTHSTVIPYKCTVTRSIWHKKRCMLAPGTCRFLFFYCVSACFNSPITEDKGSPWKAINRPSMLNLQNQLFCEIRSIHNKYIIYCSLFILSIDNWDLR